jgi:chemotaxis protein histidine kinase CheA/CheY-like chemotaxis protein
MIDSDILAVFIPEAHGYLDRIAASGDPVERARAAHGLKGACAILGLDPLRQAAEALEAALRTGSDGAPERQRVSALIESLLTGAPAEVAVPPIPEWDADELRHLRAFFLDEATEHLEAIGFALGRLHARADDREALAEVLRKLHTLKGSAGSVQLQDVSQLAHSLEDRVIALRDRGARPTQNEIDALDDGAQKLSAALRALEREVRGGTSASAAQLANDQRREDRRLIDRRADADQQTVRVEVQRIDELMDAASELVFDRTRASRRLQELDGCLRDLGKVRAELQRFSVELERVGGELPQRAAELSVELSTAMAALGRAVQGAGEDAEGLQRTSSTLQEGIRHVRMMAVGRLLSRFEQPVRELARREGKQVRWVTAGEDTEIDKAVVERIAEPILHLVRNAVAHGIEPPGVRRALGKDEVGTLSVSARHEGDAVEILVADDGRGIDREAVRRALAASGRVTADQAAQLDEATLFSTLFESGFSTRVAADDLAGRGVGLDAVKEALARLGGTVRVTSEPDRGATFVVRLPLTTAVQEALLFKVGGHVYALPAARVLESVPVSPDDLRIGGPDGIDRIHLPLPDGTRELPVVRLGALFGVPAPPGGNPRRSALVLSVGVGDESQTFAVTCDKVIGPREIVVRSMGPLLSHLPLYAGATISGAGKVQLILDVAQLAELARRGVRAVRPSHALGPRRALVADDSRSIREAASLILAQGGFSVETVPDGWDAWELLQDRPFDVLLTDLEMPRLDGHELLTRVRRSPELAGLSVVVISSRTNEVTRTQVAADGADAFVAKPLRRKALLDAVEAALRARAAA